LAMPTSPSTSDAATATFRALGMFAVPALPGATTSSWPARPVARACSREPPPTINTRDMRANYHRTFVAATIAAVSENSRPPQVAIRIVRPYQTEEEFLTNELETVGKTSIILIGAHPRPAGIILRFEVTLATGATVLRGEGRVLAHKERAFRGQPGLSLRFTRLDPKSKSLVDRAVTMREQRLSGEAPSMRPPAPSAPSHPPVEPADRSAPPPPAAAHEVVSVPISFPAPADPALEAALTASTPEPPLNAPYEQTPTPRLFERVERVESSMEYSLAPSPPSIDRAIAAAFEPPISSNPVAVEPLSEPSIAATPTRETPRDAAEAPKDREGILARLRERAASLSSERVREILSARKS
jgi:hypothetical protein